MMQTIAFLLDTHFEQVEYEAVNNKLQDKGYKTILITTNKDKEVQGLNHVDKGDVFTADLFANEANPDDYAALVLPGGTVNADTLRGNTDAKRLITGIYEANKPLAAICHAPWALINAQIVKGKTVTAYKTLQTDLENAGASFVDKSVQIDGNLITSRNPDDIDDFVTAIDDALAQ